MISISTDLYKYTQFRGRTEDNFPGLYGKASSVQVDGNKRIEEAERQADREPTAKEKVIELTTTFFEEVVGIPNITVVDHKIDKGDIRKNKNVGVPYGPLKDKYKLNNINHIIWLKFNTDGYLGCVAASNDINFGNTNPSGMIIAHLKKKWNEEFVLIVPLPQITDGLRKDLECGLGNYLSEKGVPILDFYSHRFQ